VRKIWKGFTKVIDGLGIFMFIALSVIVFLQVVFRFVLRLPAPWSEEMARYLLVTMTFIGAAIAVRYQSHLVAVNIFRKAPKTVAVGANLLVECAILFFSVLMLKGSIDMILIAGTETATSFTWLRMAYVYTIIPFSLGLICVYTVINIFRKLKHFQQDPSGE
jgi:TRAP-type C4-dicarboxylate transport system permease small subunit